MKRIFSILFIVIFFVGCGDDFLNESNPNTITKEAFWKSEGDVLKALAGTYNYLGNLDNGGYYDHSGMDLTIDRGDDFTAANSFNYLPGIGSNVWNGAYKGIFRANQIIEETPQISTISDDSKKRYIAEVKFLRGLNYFHLASNWGAVPIHLTTPKSMDEYFVAKSPEDSVYIQIISDFTDAAEGLPISYSSEWVGRATKGAALGFMGKAYLYQKDYAKAEIVFEQLMQPPFSYALMNNYADNFDLQHENNIESVFEIQVQDVGGTYMWASDANENLGTRLNMEYMPREVGGWSQVYTTNKILMEFQKEKTTDGEFDPRMVATLIWEGEPGLFYQRPISDFFPDLYDTKCKLKKYLNWQQENEEIGINGGVHSSSINIRALRYADVLLMHAEAVTMQGRPQDAYNDVNLIRQRAHLSDLPAGYNQGQMMAEIRHQRMIEFVFEGQRFYDLRRWGLLQQEISNSDKRGRENFDPEKHQYLPIPQSEMDNNPKMEQLPGW
ncbi:RagB/SusD family nutrient uptake outer membrane protein [Sunxiuqinia sp. A32]|uniref:RagB/SusD family nutrient uptake outer membrane protein n=1 Tax=Sunxiuqinia sp. A32 TaxID=3461496 RepID=UPI0040456BE0